MAAAEPSSGPGPWRDSGELVQALLAPRSPLHHPEPRATRPRELAPKEQQKPWRDSVRSTRVLLLGQGEEAVLELGGGSGLAPGPSCPTGALAAPERPRSLPLRGRVSCCSSGSLTLTCPGTVGSTALPSARPLPLPRPASVLCPLSLSGSATLCLPFGEGECTSSPSPRRWGPGSLYGATVPLGPGRAGARLLELPKLLPEDGTWAQVSWPATASER